MESKDKAASTQRDAKDHEVTESSVDVPDQHRGPADIVQRFPRRAPSGVERHLEPGTVLAERYRIVRFIGRGGMGEVYRADDLVLDQSVAVKIFPERLRARPGRLEQFLNEAKVSRRITHPNVCRVYDLGTASGLHFISMELIAGDNLASRLRRQGPPPHSLALDLGRQICYGLAAAHEQGVLHRDLKPANILIDTDNRAHVTDFGIAVLAEDAEDGAPRSGTPAYMAPEQHQGKAGTIATDLYALGLVLYELFTGRRTFEAELAAELAWRHCSIRPEPPSSVVPQIDSAVEHVILRCLEKDPRDRPSSARRVVEALTENEHRCVLKVLVHREPCGQGMPEAIRPRNAARVRELLDEHHGVAIEDLGRMPWIFDRPGDALRFALAYQEELSGRDIPPDLPGEGPGPSDERVFPVRMGLHLGEIVRGEACGVDGLDTPQLRIEEQAAATVSCVSGIAEGGQILLTRGAFDLARQGIETEIPAVRWLAHGSYEVEGIAEPLEIFEVGRDGRAPLRPPQDSPGVRRQIVQPTITGWRPAPGLVLPLRSNWRIERKLSEGGFGEVWLAAHAKTGERRVFKFCFDAERLRALQREITLFRLLKEELGRRDDIAHILDWDLERPPYYIESAYTAGGNLAEWVAARGGVAGLPLAARLEIVARIAAALAAAHSVGVLHKDIKPANILITEVDGAVRAQLTDFGIGQLTDRQRLSRAGITALGFTRTEPQESPGEGTRLYQAPEVLEGRPATLQADVYALGVTLYQLVVGDFSRALAPGWEQDIDDELLREDIAAAVDGSPERRLGNALRLAERLRSLEERRHAREAEQQARQEAERLKVSVERLRRRRRAMAMAMAIVVFVSGVVGALAWRIAREAERANREARAAERVAAFLVELFEVSDPFESGETAQVRGAAITALELLDRGAVKVADSLQDEPEIEARLLLTIGKIYRSLGAYDDAEPLITEALALRRRLRGKDSPDVLESLSELGILRRFQGKYQEAERIHRQILTERRRVLGEEHTDIAESLNSLASVLDDLGDHGAAVPLYREALAMRRELHGDDHILVGESLNNLALLLGSKMSDHAAAEPLLRESLAILRRHYGEEHPNVAAALSNLGILLSSKGDLEGAEELHREALRIGKRLLGDDHPSIATRLNNLATVLDMQGDYEAAEPLYQEVLALRRRLLGDEHPLVAMTFNNFAVMYWAMGDYEAAVPMYREALRLLGSDHPDDTIWILRNLAHVLCVAGDHAEGEELYREALALDRQRFGAERADIAESLDGLGACLYDKGDDDRAEALILEGLAMRRRLLGREHPSVAKSLETLGRLLVARGEHIRAEPVIRESLAIRRKAWPEHHWRLAFTDSILGSCLAGLGRDAEAEPLLVESYAALKENGAGVYYRREALQRVVDFYEVRGELEKAAEYRVSLGGNGTR